MKIAFSADWHISNFGPDKVGPITDRGAACLRVVERLYEIPGVPMHVALGDIYNEDRPSPGLERALQDRMTKTTAMIVGNHDQTSTAPGHHALAPLKAQAHIVEDVEVFDIGPAQIGLVGFRHRDGVLEALSRLDWAPKDGFRVLGVHLGIADERTPPFLRNASDSIALETIADAAAAHGITHVMAGNWHNPEDWTYNGVRVCQVGGLIPQRFGDTHTTHGRVALFDANTGEITFKCLAGPRFITVEGDPPWETPDVPDADPLHVRFRTGRENAAKARELVEDLAHGSVDTVRIDPTDVRPETPDDEEPGAVSTGEEMALAAAEKVEGPALVDVLRSVFVRAHGDGYVAARGAGSSATLRVKRITRKNYMVEGGTETLTLPQKGLVLLTGDNGSGKSSWIDVVGAAWNADVRDDKARSAQGYLTDAVCLAGVETHDGTEVTRKWKTTGKQSLDWRSTCHSEGEGDESTTRSKSQAALNAVLGDYRLWRWASVLTSPSDAFTVATPARRRTMMENVLDMDLLAKGYAALHEMTKEERKAHAVQTSALEAAKSTTALAQDGATAAYDAQVLLGTLTLPPRPAPLEAPSHPREPVFSELVLPDMPQLPPEVRQQEVPAPPEAPTPVPPLDMPQPPQAPPEPRLQTYEEPSLTLDPAPEPPSTDPREELRSQYAALQERMGDYRAERAELEQDLQRVVEEERTATQALQVAQASADKLGSGACPTCTQEITAETVERFAGDVHRCTAEAERAASAATEVSALVRRQLADLDQRVFDCDQEMGDIDNRLTHADHVWERFEAEQLRHAIDTRRREQQYERDMARHTQRTEDAEAQYQADVADRAERHEKAVRDHERACQRLKEQHREAERLAVDDHERAVQRHHDAVAAAGLQYVEDVANREMAINAARRAHSKACEDAKERHERNIAAQRATYDAACEEFEQQLVTLAGRQEEQSKAYDEHCAEVTAQFKMREERLEASADAAAERMAKAKAAQDVAAEELAETTERLRLYELAETIISPTGKPRTTALDRAMRSVMVDANKELEKLESTMRVRLFADGKDVGLEIIGDDNRPKKYARLSNGEKRRVDIALLRALGVTAANVRGAEDNGTIFFDETLDGVDNAGIDAACEYVQAMARRRCVVVITHRPDVMSRLRPVKHITMTAGAKPVTSKR